MTHQNRAMSPETEPELAAANATDAARQEAKRQIKAYRLRAQLCLRDWLLANPRRISESKEAHLARWEGGWLKSQEGKEAGSALACCLAAFNIAAQRELRLATTIGQLDAAACVQRKADEIQSRDSDPGWEDQALDRILTTSARRVIGELAPVPSIGPTR